MQNPNVTPSIPPTPSDLQKGRKMWIWVGVVVAVVVAGLVWYFSAEPLGLPQLPSPTPTSEAGVFDNQLNTEVDNIDLGDVNSEFQVIDADINSL